MGFNEQGANPSRLLRSCPKALSEPGTALSFQGRPYITSSFQKRLRSKCPGRHHHVNRAPLEVLGGFAQFPLMAQEGVQICEAQYPFGAFERKPEGHPRPFWGAGHGAIFSISIWVFPLGTASSGTHVVTLLVVSVHLKTSLKSTQTQT